MTSKLTRERIELIANFHRAMTLPPSHAEIEELARIALAAMDSEPVAYMYDGEDGTEYNGHNEFSGGGKGIPLYRHAHPAPERDQVRIAHAEWSQATFGNVGPVGPLKHLSKEALEAAAEPGDMSEWADMQFLLWDAQRRAGITDEQITQAMFEKLAVNKQREWPEPKDGEPRLHIKEQPAPVVPDDVLKALQKVARIRLDMDGFDGDRRGIADCLCDAEEALIDVVNRRAAMFNHPEQHLDMVDHSGDVNEKGGDGNSPVIPDGWTCNDKANAALMMLDRIETVDPVDDDRIDGIKRIVRELAAAQHDTHALNSVQSVDSVADRWIPVSERMPENDGAYLCWDNRYVTTYAFIFGAWQANQFIAKNITHWMPLPAGPQEVR
ncbi:DUF550 domain-containing protein [Klebsiella pneumoniae]|uniref:dATP/dGTP pyrophosphohydrolase domain-containing protein n=2 Tax=Klebsiella pneumoniae TaxID=573 RepID=UPI0024068AEC|nr:dATP/dGTP pyrophosphohydrolase domain-containing protein [Klebsiella pneumoniae]MDG0780751.1 DUF550 domain-containing protein [Klebsiella pneumoniae]